MKKIVVSFIAGCIAATAFSVHAEVSSLVGRAIEGAFPVKYNEASLGEGLVIEGTTYLPVRKLGEAMGLNVTFDADLGVNLTPKTVGDSVYGDNQPAENPKYQKLRDLDAEKKALQKQIEELYPVLEPYEKVIAMPGQPLKPKEKDSLYYETKKTRDEAITKRDEIEQQIKDLANQK